MSGFLDVVSACNRHLSKADQPRAKEVAQAYVILVREALVFGPSINELESLAEDELRPVTSFLIFLALCHLPDYRDSRWFQRLTDQVLERLDHQLLALYQQDLMELGIFVGLKIVRRPWDPASSPTSES